MNKNGFTLIEVLITILIMAVVISMTIPVYTRVVSGISNFSASSESKIDNLLAMEMIRLDLQHVGTGIGLNETAFPIIYNEGASTLDLRATLINTNQATLGWGLINCTGAAAIVAGDYIVDQREDTTNKNMVLLNTEENTVDVITAGTYNCPAAVGLYTAFPYTQTVGAANSCIDGFCTNIRYSLSANQPLETCAGGTLNLLRAVGGGAGDPLVNCVAGFRVRFDLDADLSGAIAVGETSENNVPPGTPLQTMQQVKNIDMYILVQVGQSDSTLNSTPTLMIDGVDFTADYNALTDEQNYSWKIFKISGKPNGWL